MAWTLLQQPDQWAPYCNEFLRSRKMEGTLVDFGKGPVAYPCLVATAVTSPLKAISAYVYEEDAERLLKVRKPVAAVVSDEERRFQNEQQRFNKWVVAHFLAVAHFLVETKICTKPQFEARLAEGLEMAEDQHSTRIREMMSEMDESILKKLRSELP